MKAESDSNVMGDQLAKSQSEIVQMSLEEAYNRTEKADIDEPTKKEAVLHPLNIFWNDINEEVGNIE